LEKEKEHLKHTLEEILKVAPKERVRKLVIEKPVQVMVEVPKYINKYVAGPERLVHKIV
jgi:hypothetical protein